MRWKAPTSPLTNRTNQVTLRMHPVEDVGVNTSLVTVLSSAHGRQRREERDITKRDLKAAVKYGTKEATPGQGRNLGLVCWKYTFAGVVYITDIESKVEITSWPEQSGCGFDVPLIRITRSMTTAHNAAVANLHNLGSWTSHTVIVVDQSGSMRQADVEGKATRAEAVWLTLAFSCVADEIRSGSRKGSDVMSIIGMKNTSALLVDREPVDWQLFNKIVGFLRKERPSEGGIYADSIELAETCLMKNTRGSCALQLLFLSDGKPSDNPTSVYFEGTRTNVLTRDQRERRRASGMSRSSQEATQDRDSQLGARIGDLASRFGRRLTVGTIGFADQSEDFAALKTLTAECAAYDCQASFHAPALTAHSLKQVLTSLSSTLTATKTEMTAVGGAAQRTVRNVLRESKMGVADDMCANKDNWYIYDGLISCFERTTWDSDKATATGGKDPWTHHPMFLHQGASGVAMRKKIFGEGAERMVSKFREYDKDGNFIGPWMVAKESRYVEETGNLRDSRVFHSTFCKTQQTADRIAQEFNFRLATIPGVSSSSPRIRFLDCHVYVLQDSIMGKVGLLVEKMLDVSRYQKWNTNNGGIAGVPSSCAEAVHAPDADDLLDGMKDLGLNAIVEDNEGEDDSDEEDVVETEASRPMAARIGDVAISFTISDIPQAFSCFSHRFSGKKYLVCDLQGVLNETSVPPCFELTDPVIHYKSKSGRRAVFGRTDRGPKGINDFYKTHQCSELCRALMKEWINPKVELSETSGRRRRAK